jgi:VRR-NUC domain
VTANRARLTSPALPALPMNEKEFMALVVDYATRAARPKWKVYHPRWSMQSAAGWPDLVLCRPPRIVLAELKSDRGKVDAAQQKWLDLLQQCPGVETHLWRPKDWDQIEEILK